MPTTFNWIYLGRTGALDPTEGDSDAENANNLVTTTWGSTGSPLYDRIRTVTTIDNGGAAGALDNNNNVVNDQFITDIGAGPQTFTFDTNVVYSVTITYSDGTSATISGVLVQSTSGDLFFAPEITANSDTTAQEFKPIVSIAIGNVINATNNLNASRATTGWDDGWVEGTSGADLINGTYVEPIGNGTDRVDNNDGIVASSLNDDRIRAGGGNDTVLAGLGNDLVYGGTGADSLSGEAGNDTLYGEDGSDRLYGGDNSDLLYGGIELDSLYGGTGTDTLYGDAGNDALFGGDGGDLAYGGADGDSVYGDAGADTLYGDAGNDTVYGGADDDVVDGGTESDLVYGDGGNDTVSGGAGTDTVFGGTGQDVLYGGAGRDFLYGGDDQDRIFVTYTGAQNDVLGSETVDGGSGGIDNDTLSVDITGFGWGRIDLVYDPLNSENGTITFFGPDGITVVGTLTFTDIENLVIVCFTRGTLIQTDNGPVPVEALRPGDLVVTRDNGLQPLRWVGRRTLSAVEMRARPDLQPVRIGAGALGVGPVRSMLVSPQHRVLIEGARAEMYFGESEVLVPAKHLTSLAEVERALPADGVTYVHILFDRHEIVLSDGIWTESFQPAERTLSALDAAARAEVLALFPELEAVSGEFPAARLSLKAHEAKVLVSA